MFVIKCTRDGLTRPVYYQDFVGQKHNFAFIPSLAKWYKTPDEANRQVKSLYGFLNIEILAYTAARKYHKEAIDDDQT